MGGKRVLSRRRFLGLLTGAAASGLVVPQFDWDDLAREVASPARTYFVGGMAEFPPPGTYTTDALFDSLPEVIGGARRLREHDGVMLWLVDREGSKELTWRW